MNPEFKRGELWMDSENGGLDPKIHTPLEFAFLAVINNKIADRLMITIRPETMVVTGAALEVNKQDLSKGGLSLEATKKLYLSFMNRNFYSRTLKAKNGIPEQIIFDRPNKETMPFFCGHNTAYDRPFLQAVVGEFDYCYYHRIDTMLFSNILFSEGLLPGLENMKLETISNYLALPPPPRFHDALMDVEQTFRVYQCLKQIMRGKSLAEIRETNVIQLSFF